MDAEREKSKTKADAPAAPETPRFTLVRWAHTDHGILGRMGRWYVLENQWRDNRRNVSAIPAGVYRCTRGVYHRGGYPAFELQDVPGRSLILIHAGNTDQDTRGCPLIGSRVGVLGGRLAVLDSRAALAEFMATLEGVDEFELKIVNNYDPAHHANHA